MSFSRVHPSVINMNNSHPKFGGEVVAGLGQHRELPSRAIHGTGIEEELTMADTRIKATLGMRGGPNTSLVTATAKKGIMMNMMEDGVESVQYDCLLSLQGVKEGDAFVSLTVGTFSTKLLPTYSI